MKSFSSLGFSPHGHEILVFIGIFHHMVTNVRMFIKSFNTNANLANTSTDGRTDRPRTHTHRTHRTHTHTHFTLHTLHRTHTEHTTNTHRTHHQHTQNTHTTEHRTQNTQHRKQNTEHTHTSLFTYMTPEHYSCCAQCDNVTLG